MTNFLQYAGEAIVQICVGYEGSRHERHPKDLKGLQRVNFKAGETVTMTFRLGLEELACCSLEEGG